MSDLELFQLPEGDAVKTGLLLPSQGETLVGSIEEYPDNLLLDDADLKKLLPDGWEKSQRQRFAKSMINQSRLGKCNASANVGAMEQVMSNDGRDHVPLCDNQLYYRVNGGSDSGSTLISTFREIQANGISSRIIDVDGKPYKIPGDVFNARSLPREVVEAAAKDAQRFKGWEAYLLPKVFDKFARSVASALARRHPIVWAWHVTNAGMQLRNGYLVQGRGGGNHSNVAISAKFVGGRDLVHPTNRNSWGPTTDPIYGPMGSGWGEGGFASVTMEDFFACIPYHDFYVLTSVNIDPLDELLRFKR